jgi:hypothetical protein
MHQWNTIQESERQKKIKHCLDHSPRYVSVLHDQQTYIDKFVWETSINYDDDFAIHQIFRFQLFPRNDTMITD